MKQMIKGAILQVYKLHPEKADLLMRTADVFRSLYWIIGNKKASVYIHIPFCSSRCHYCSFPSDLISRVSDKMEAYLECLELEIAPLSWKRCKRKGAQVDTVYIGGGTPTVLEHSHLEKLLKLVKEQELLEVSHPGVHGGSRPSGQPGLSQSLQLMKEYGVNRLSINPQSMNQETLDLIGRKHTVEELSSGLPTSQGNRI
jgi:oxygen-independent coproporphyrinogen-3 oxidase